MLLRTLFAVALTCALLEPAVRAAHADAQAALRIRADIVAGSETQLAVERARRDLAIWIASGNDAADGLPAAFALPVRCALHDGERCALQANAAVQWSIPQPPRASPCPNGACTAYDQANDDVREGRIEATAIVQAREPAGALIAERTTHVRFRTWQTAPYAALDGRGDATFSPNFDDSGDDGGASGADGTLESTVFRNALTGATTPANVWKARVAPASSASARWSP